MVRFDETGRKKSDHIWRTSLFWRTAIWMRLVKKKRKKNDNGVLQLEQARELAPCFMT